MVVVGVVAVVAGGAGRASSASIAATRARAPPLPWRRGLAPGRAACRTRSATRPARVARQRDDHRARRASAVRAGAAPPWSPGASGGGTARIATRTTRFFAAARAIAALICAFSRLGHLRRGGVILRCGAQARGDLGERGGRSVGSRSRREQGGGKQCHGADATRHGGKATPCCGRFLREPSIPRTIRSTKTCVLGAHIL